MANFKLWLKGKNIKSQEIIALCREAWERAEFESFMKSKRANHEAITREREGCALECLEISESFEDDQELAAVAKICRTKILLRGVKL